MQVLLLPLQVLPLTDLQNRLVLALDDVPCAWGVQAVCLHAPTSHYYYFWNPATLEPWNLGTLQPCTPGTLLGSWNPETLEPLEPLEPWKPWDPETVGPWYPGTLEPLKP